jgi:lysozyme
LAKVKVNKVGNATVTIKQCNKIITTKVKVEKAKCIDVSEWNGDINFSKVKNAGITCVILRAGYGKDPNQEDNKFNEYYRQAKAAGLNVGAYWYSYATSVDAAKAEVRNCMKTIRGKEFDLPVFLDVEEYRQAVLPRRTLTDIISTFCDGVKGYGFDVGMYSAKSMLVDSAYPDELASKYLIWMAAPNNSYNELPPFVDIHQYSWNGKVDGIRGDVDLNYIYNLN